MPDDESKFPPGGFQKPREDRRQKDLYMSAYPRDLEMVEWLAEYLGCSRSEAVRSAVRVYYAILNK